jgi:protein gp37
MRAKNPNEKIRSANAGLTDGARFNGTVRVREDRIFMPLAVDKPTVWAVWTDLFHEAVPDEFIGLALQTMKECPDDIFVVLTKRPERMAAVSRQVIFAPNVMPCVSVEEQATADERLPHLLATRAAWRGVSIEPMLGPVDLTEIGESTVGLFRDGALRPLLRHNTLTGKIGCGPAIVEYTPTLDWVIVGGETGPGARPMHPDWVRSIRDQCSCADVPLFFKSWGEWAYCRYPDDPGQIDPQKVKFFPAMDAAFWRIGKKSAGRLLDGKTHDAFPGDVQ